MHFLNSLRVSFKTGEAQMVKHMESTKGDFCGVLSPPYCTAGGGLSTGAGFSATWTLDSVSPHVGSYTAVLPAAVFKFLCRSVKQFQWNQRDSLMNQTLTGGLPHMPSKLLLLHSYKSIQKHPCTALP